MGFSFEAPLALLLLVPALAITIALYLSARRRLGAGRRRLALFVRTALLVALVFALAGFRIVLPVDRLATVFVVDLSDSVGNDESIITRWRRRSMMWSTCSIDTGHSRTQAPQVTQSHTTLSLTAPGTSGAASRLA